MSKDELDNSQFALNIDAEEDYLRQVKDIEEQNKYLETEIPLSDDISSIGLKKQLNIEGGRQAKKSLLFDLKDVSVFRLYFI